MEAALRDTGITFPCPPEEFGLAVGELLDIKIITETTDSLPIATISDVKYEPSSRTARIQLSSDIVNDALRTFSQAHEIGHIFVGHVRKALRLDQLTSIQGEEYENEANAIACLILGPISNSLFEGDKVTALDELPSGIRSFAAFIDFVPMG